MGQYESLLNDESDACQAFVAAWSRGEQPSLKDALQPFSAESQRRLLPILLEIELNQRRSRGESLSCEEHLQAFPAEQQLIQGVAARFIDTAPVVDGATLSVVDAPDGYVHRGYAAESPTAAGDATDKKGNGDASRTATLMFEQGGDASSSAANPAAPRPIARPRFLPIREHAQGGLGKVYLAHDTELNREVALKEIQPRHADNRSARTRFVLEAEVTGGLEHPGIVPVYGLGAYIDGRPYYAMRFIRGESLKDAIDGYHRKTRRTAGERAVALRQLIKHFIDVCHAIDYAHSRGVLHRDIKPGNIMLGKFGETLVVDWGLAKTQGRDEVPSSGVINESALVPVSGSAVEPTMMGTTVGTPLYMSPEQAAGKLDILGPETDVFSLGATLYELLTSKAPYFDVPRDQLMQRVKLGEFPRPRTLRQDIPKPLEAICLKSMAFEPKDRYSRASGLIADLERFLADEPVSAYQEPLWERSARFVRRNRQYVMAATAALAAIAIITTVAALVANEARRKEAIAKVAEEKAKAVATQNYLIARDSVDRWMTGGTDALNYYPGFRKIKQNLLEAAAEDYEKFAQFKSDDPGLELERGRAWMLLGDAQEQLAQPDKALESWQEAESVFSEQAAKSDKAWQPQFVCEQIAALTRQGQALRERAQPSEALAALSKGEKLRSMLGELDSWPLMTLATVGNLYLHRAAIYIEQKDAANSRDALREATTILDRLPSEGETQLTIEAIRVSRYKYQARLAKLEGKANEAVAPLQEAIARSKQLVEKYPRDAVRLRDWTAAYEIELALSLQKLGQLQKQLDVFQAADQQYVELLQAVPDAPTFREQRAILQTDMSHIYWELEKLTEGTESAEAATATLHELSQRYPEMVPYRVFFVAATEMWGRYENDRGQTTSAADLLKVAVATLDLLVEQSPEAPDYHHRRAIARTLLAVVLDDPQQSDPLILDSIEEFEELVKLTPDVPEFYQSQGFVLWQSAWWLQRHGREVEAALQAAAAEKAWGNALRLSPTPDVQHAAARFNLDRPDRDSKHVAEGLKLARLAIDVAPDNPEFQWTYGWALSQSEDLKTWEKWLEEYKLPPTYPILGRLRDRYLRAAVLLATGKTDEAIAIAKEADDLLAAQRPGNLELRRLSEELQRKLTAQP